MRYYLRWMEWKFKLLAVFVVLFFPFPVLLSLKGSFPYWVGMALSLPLLFVFLNCARRAENYKAGRKVEEYVEGILKTCVPFKALLKSDVKIKYGNIDFLVMHEEKVLILEVKAGKLKGERLKRTYEQVQRQIEEIRKRFPQKEVSAFVINTGEKSFYYKDLKIVCIKEMCYEILGILHTTQGTL